MTPTQINQAIAELCGWKMLEKPSTLWGFAAYAIDPDEKPQPGIPNYAADLNAIRGALHSLSNDQMQGYIETLFRVANPKEANQHYSGLDDFEAIKVSWNVINATALQRCEAFLRVNGAWKEGKE